MLGALKPGDTIGGKYRIIRQIGQGGMGVVFEAENVLTVRRVALKCMLANRALESDSRGRLLREARAVARIQHRNVMDLYDVVIEQDTVILVMELLQGETLEQLLSSRVLPIPAFLRLLIQAMRGVAHAHRVGILHRDIKPENILVTREPDQSEPVPKILDFGVAKLDEGDAITRSGHLIGTPLFMSYEQLRGERELDGRVDVYAFGVILYLALAGRTPYEARTIPELIYRVAMVPVEPLHVLRPELPEALSAVVAHAIARERDQRLASIDALIERLTPFAVDAVLRSALDGSELFTQRVQGDGYAATEELEERRAAATVRATSFGSANEPAVDGQLTASVKTTSALWRRRGSVGVLVGLAALVTAGFVIREFARESTPRSPGALPMAGSPALLQKLGTEGHAPAAPSSLSPDAGVLATPDTVALDADAGATNPPTRSAGLRRRTSARSSAPSERPSEAASAVVTASSPAPEPPRSTVAERAAPSEPAAPATAPSPRKTVLKLDEFWPASR